jgi:hypothetical protein
MARIESLSNGCGRCTAYQFVIAVIVAQLPVHPRLVIGKLQSAEVAPFMCDKHQLS